MLAKLEQYAALLSANDLKRAKHALIVLPKTESLEALRGVPAIEALSSSLSRRKKKLEELAKSPIATDLPQGGLAAWVMLEATKSMFERQTLLRRAACNCRGKSSVPRADRAAAE
jgi:leucyl aminopeptidase